MLELHSTFSLRPFGNPPESSPVGAHFPMLPVPAFRVHRCSEVVYLLPCSRSGCYCHRCCHRCPPVRPDQQKSRSTAVPGFQYDGGRKHQEREAIGWISWHFQDDNKAHELSSNICKSEWKSRCLLGLGLDLPKNKVYHLATLPLDSLVFLSIPSHSQRNQGCRGTQKTTWNNMKSTWWYRHLFKGHPWGQEKGSEYL